MSWWPARLFYTVLNGIEPRMSRCSSVRVYINNGPTHADAMITTAGGTRLKHRFDVTP
jgi:hypothetical protein